MKPSITAMLFGMLLSTAACLAGDPTEMEPAEAEVEAEAIVRPPPPPGPAFYYTCSDQPLVCNPGYGAVEWIIFPDCQPRANHRVKCVAGAVDL